MPIEAIILASKPEPLSECPLCHARPFRSFLRGMVQRGRYKWFGFGPKRPYCAIICWECKEIVGYE